MKTTILKTSLIALLLVAMGAGCKKEKLTDETRKAQDYLGKYSGNVIRNRMASNGWLVHKNAFVEKVPTEVEITQSEQGHNFLMVYVSAYNDSILCEFDESTGYIWIRDKPYSFYMRKRDFPEFRGTYDMAVSTYGKLGTWQNTDTIVFSIDFLKNMNDSIYFFETATKKITKYEKDNNLNAYFSCN
jgi:hypothetical protein